MLAGQLAGKIALITGAAHRMGAGTARSFAAEAIGSVHTQGNSFLIAHEEGVEERLKTILSQRFGRAEEIAGLATQRASDRASYMVGQAVSIGGGKSARMAQPGGGRLTGRTAQRTRAV